MSVRSAQSITKVFTTRRFDTGAATNADSTPTGTLYVNGTADGASVTVTNITTGLYKAAVTLPTLALNDIVDLRISATVNSVTDNAVVWSDTKDVFAGTFPDVAAGAAGGLFIAGSNAATTVAGLTTGALACTTITASGAVAFQSTFAVTTSTSLAALSCTTLTASGAVAFQSTFAVTTSTSLAALSCTTLTASGAVAFQSTLAVTGTTTLAALNTGAIGTGNVTITGTLSTSGTTTFNALTVTNALTVSGATTLTGAVTASNASNNIVGIDVAKIAGTAYASSELHTLASHDPGATLASQTNITAGTITTATNVTTVNGLAANVITAAAIADAAIDRATFAADTGLQTVRSGTCQASGNDTTNVHLDAGASGTSLFYNNMWLYFTGGTGVGQVTKIESWNGTTKIATVSPALLTAADGTTTFAVLPDIQPGIDDISALLPPGFVNALFTGDGYILADVRSWITAPVNALQSGRVDAYVGAYASGQAPLQPTTAGRTLDVSATGEAGVDWANVGGQSTSVNLSGTTVNLTNTLTTYTGNTPQTGDVYAQTSSGTFGLAAIKGYVDDIGIAGAGLTALGDTRLANLDAAVSGRMATYTQPTGFLAATFPATVASTTNITAASGVALSSTGLNIVMVDGKTLPAALQIIAAAAIGKVSGAGTGTEIFVGLDGSTTRATVTVDSSGNRTAVVYV
jgi:hypothetical protein